MAKKYEKSMVGFEALKKKLENGFVDLLLVCRNRWSKLVYVVVEKCFLKFESI